MVVDLQIRDAYLNGPDEVLDIEISDGIIMGIVDESTESARETVDADGNLVAPGFVDCHKHLDRAFAATGDRKPCDTDVDDHAERFEEYYRSVSYETVRERIIEDIEMAVCAGTTRIRNHVVIDHCIGTDTMRVCIEATDATSDIVYLQHVPGTMYGVVTERGERLLREGIETGLEELDDPDAVLPGGSDPVEINADLSAVGKWFEMATDLGVDVDVHVSEHGTDNDQDFLIAHGNADSLQAAQVISLKLRVASRSGPNYDWAEENEGFEFIWDRLTRDGAVVAEDGELRPEYRITGSY